VFGWWIDQVSEFYRRVDTVASTLVVFPPCSSGQSSADCLGRVWRAGQASDDVVTA
jgi:hypothetical protein